MWPKKSSLRDCGTGGLNHRPQQIQEKCASVLDYDFYIALAVCYCKTFEPFCELQDQQQGARLDISYLR